MGTLDKDGDADLIAGWVMYYNVGGIHPRQEFGEVWEAEELSLGRRVGAPWL